MTLNNKFIFDVDGTLTPSRGRIDKKFAAWFSRFCETHDVYLVTGSDRPKTIEQIGEVIYHQCKRVYNCSGNDVWSGDLHVKTSEWRLPAEAETYLNDILKQSQFPLRTGLHIEHRPGMVNFSVVGRNAKPKERAEYVAWDREQNERNEVAQQFNFLFPEIEARPGGETGIDIAPRGSNKSQILVDFNQDADFIMFYGDRMDEGGNDFPLADALFRGWQGANYPVEDWQHTWDLLKEVE
jgi:phosphomannomutase